MEHLRHIAIAVALTILASEAPRAASAEDCVILPHQSEQGDRAIAQLYYDWALTSGIQSVRSHKDRVLVYRIDKNGTPSDADDDLWVLHDSIAIPDVSTISIDGTIAAIGSKSNEIVTVLDRDEQGTPSDPTDDVWSVGVTIEPPAGFDSRRFGERISVSQGRMLIGGSTLTETVFVYRQVGLDWEFEAELLERYDLKHNQQIRATLCAARDGSSSCRHD